MSDEEDVALGIVIVMFVEPEISELPPPRASASTAAASVA